MTLSKFSRRSFLSSSAALAAGAALGPLPRAMSMPTWRATRPSS
ncbi:twin-arginine translocation signal domain-containing protein [Mangrovicoccus ximenensis]